MTRMCIAYYSATGNCRLLAEAAMRALEEAGAEVRTVRVPDLVETPPSTDPEATRRLADANVDVPLAKAEDLVWADGIILGTPVHFGLPAPPMVHFLDLSAPPSIAGELQDKPVSVFTSGSAPHGGQVTTIAAMHNAVCHWGALIVPNGSTDEVLFRPTNGCPTGISNVSRNQAGNVDEDNLAAMEHLALRTLRIASTLIVGRGAQ